MDTVDMYLTVGSGGVAFVRAGGSRKPAESAQTQDPAQYAVMTPDNERTIVASRLQHALA